MVPRHQRDIRRPAITHGIIQSIVNPRNIVPRIVGNGRPLRPRRSRRARSPRNPLRPGWPLQPLRPHRARGPGSPRSARSKQPPLPGPHIRRIPMIPCPPARHTQRRCRSPHPPAHSSPPTSTPPEMTSLPAPANTLRSHRPLQSLRSSSTRQTLRPSLPRNPLQTLRTLLPWRPHRPRQPLRPLRASSPGRAPRARGPRRRQHPPLPRTETRSIPPIPSHQRRIARPIPKHHIPHPIIRCRRVSPLIHQPRKTLYPPGRPPATPTSPAGPAGPSPIRHRPGHSLRPTPVGPCPALLRQQSPVPTDSPPAVFPLIRGYQRRIARPAQHHYVPRRVVADLSRCSGPLITPQHPTLPRSLPVQYSPIGP